MCHCTLSEHAQQSQGMMDDRKTLGPIGTERAARRPVNVAASMYPADFNMAAADSGSGQLPESWNMYADGMSFTTLVTLSYYFHNSFFLKMCDIV